MENELQFFKIPNELIINNTDSEIYTFILLLQNEKWGECRLSQETLTTNFGQNEKFYSRAINKLKNDGFINVKTNYAPNGQKRNNIYSCIKSKTNYTEIYNETIANIENYEDLVYYLKLKRWVNYETKIATEITKQKIAEASRVSKNTSNKYLTILQDLKLITLEEDEKYINCFTLTLIEELRIIKINNEIKEWNNS